MKIALIVGINHYDNVSHLKGCVNDAYNVRSVLERNGDGSVNFDCILKTASSVDEKITRTTLKDSIQNLFTRDADVALFYFAGHGDIESTGGYILASDVERGDDGVSLADILLYANRSPARNKIIILDSCHSGFAGNLPSQPDTASLKEGITILTASASDQYASEEKNSGVFTGLLVDALRGGAANLVGAITPGSVYAHIDQSLGGWEQRPIFKTNVRSFVSLRDVSPPITLENLRAIAKFFPTPGHEFQLDPSYEPDMRGREPGMPLPDENKIKVFAILQQYNRLNLLVPVGALHMWHAAMESKACKLTALGEHYRGLLIVIAYNQI